MSPSRVSRLIVFLLASIAHAIPVEIGARYLKSFDVPRQLGDGSVKISPEYLQIYSGVGIGFDFMRRIGD